MHASARAIGATFTAALIASTAQGQLTLLAPGPQLGSHIGNLVTNGSFELPGGGPGVATRYWAAGTSGTPFGVPPGWTSSGSANNYAQWGCDGTVPNRLRGSGVLPDGNNALYFGNGQSAAVNIAPTFTPFGEVTFAGTPTIFLGPTFPTPVVLTQTVPTHLTPASSYILSFWVSGESSGLATSGTWDGIFGLRVTNTAAGDPLRYFAVPAGGTSAYGPDKRFEFSFTPLNPSLPVTVEFTNWGHFNLGAFGFGGTTELVLDDVMVNPVIPAPGAAAIMLLAGCLRRRR